MKEAFVLVRSRNARLNQARRHAGELVKMLKPESRPDNEDAWNELFADARDVANDAHQCVHEASAYHNVIKDNMTLSSARSEPPAHNGLVAGSNPAASTK